MAFYMLRATFYPLNAIFGDIYCYLCNFLEPWAAFMGQFHSFFLTLFRYICLFHEEWLFVHRITPKVRSMGFFYSWEHINESKVLHKLPSKNMNLPYFSEKWGFPIKVNFRPNLQGAQKFGHFLRGELPPPPGPIRGGGGILNFGFKEGGGPPPPPMPTYDWAAQTQPVNIFFLWNHDE